MKGKKNKKGKLKIHKIAISTIKLEGSSIWQWIMCLSVAIVLSIFIGTANDSKIIFSQIVELLNNIFIAFIAMEMGAYAIFQALLDDKLVWVLYGNENGNELEDSNASFLGIIILFWFSIMLNILIIILLKIIGINIALPFGSLITNLVKYIFLVIYFSVNTRILFEVRNFAINLYKIFLIHNKVTVLEKLEENNKNEVLESLRQLIDSVNDEKLKDELIKKIVTNYLEKK